MKVNLSNLLSEGHFELLQGICNYWCKSMPENSEQFDELRSMLKTYYIKVVDNAAEYNYDFVNTMTQQAHDLSLVCSEYDKRMEEYIDNYAAVCKTLLMIAEAL